MAGKSMSFPAPTTIDVCAANPQVSGRAGLELNCSYISDQLAEEHLALQDQYQPLMHRWNSANDLLTCDKMPSDTFIGGFQTKDIRIHRLDQALTWQIKGSADCQLYSQRPATTDGAALSAHSFPSSAAASFTKRLGNVRRLDCDELQKVPTLHSLTAQQLPGLDTEELIHGLGKTEINIRGQVSNLTGNLDSVASELPTVRGRCTSRECCVHTISDRESREMKTKETTDKLRSQLEKLQKKGQADEKAMGRLKRQRRKRESMHKQQLTLLKIEYCELERSLDEVKSERDSLRCQLSKVASKSAARLATIESLESRRYALESKNRELETYLDATRSEHMALQDRDHVRSLSVSSMERELDILRDTLRQIRMQVSVSPSARRYSEGLHKLQATPGKLCDPTHSEFSCITDCGTLLCTGCALDAPGFPTLGPITPCSIQYFEADRCPWCHADTWSWQHLDVQHSMTVVREITALWDAIGEQPT